MNYPTTYLSKKNTIEKAKLIYECLRDSFSSFKQDIKNLKNILERLDISDQICVDGFLNTYDIYLSDLASNINDLLIIKKTTINEDGTQIIKPVNKKDKSYTSEIWYTYNKEKYCGFELRCPCALVCKYDNFSFDPIKDGANLSGYEISIGESNHILKTSCDVMEKILNENSDNNEKLNKLTKYLDHILENIFLLENHCQSNVRLINGCLLSLNVFI